MISFYTDTRLYFTDSIIFLPFSTHVAKNDFFLYWHPSLLYWFNHFSSFLYTCSKKWFLFILTILNFIGWPFPVCYELPVTNILLPDKLISQIKSFLSTLAFKNQSFWIPLMMTSIDSLIFWRSVPPFLKLLTLDFSFCL